jgi:hypothetical protein
MDPRFSADSTPMLMPNTAQRKAAPMASENVTGIRSSRSGQTG